MITDGNARLAAARALTRRSVRRETGLFLAEGAPAVRAALRCPGVVRDVFATSAALSQHAELLDELAPDVTVSQISHRAAARLSQTVTPQGLVAVCAQASVSLADVFGRAATLAAVLVEPSDPGNVGTILRTADAAGATAVVIAGDGVDVYNGKVVRASAGSVFHLDVVQDVEPGDVLAAVAQAGLRSLATTATGPVDLADVALGEPTAWLFGNEAHGLPAAVLAAADVQVRIPIYGAAESLNVSAAAAVCLYASAAAQHRPR